LKLLTVAATALNVKMEKRVARLVEVRVTVEALRVVVLPIWDVEVTVVSWVVPGCSTVKVLTIAVTT
jgi:hypothetical protein